MTRPHLSRARLVDLAEGERPEPGTATHLDSCPRCRQDLMALVAALGSAREVPDAEPSPLFWEHFRGRVAGALAAEAGPGELGAAWTAWMRRPAVATTAASAIVLVVIVAAIVLLPRGVRQQPAGRMAEVVRGPAAAGEVDRLELLPADDASWLVLAATEDLDWEAALATGVGAVPGSADRMAAEMSPEEQTELVRLLREEIALGPS
jgi:hypothetical protein